jgi:hypothetical protein
MLKAFDLMRVQDGFPSFFRCHQSEAAVVGSATDVSAPAA